MSTHTPAEWVALLSLGLSISSAASIPFWLAVDAAPADFDPRPLLGRAGDRLLVETANARFLLRDATVSVAALLMLVTIRPEAT